VECADSRKILQAQDYALGMTLASGQAFRWRQVGSCWIGVVHGHWVLLQPSGSTIIAETAEPVRDWTWLEHYLQVNLDLTQVLASFPNDVPLQAAVKACHGLRLLRQDPWECLASFILSSTKQILQIQQIVSLVCERFGESISVPEGCAPVFAFPTPERLAEVSEAELRDCKMGFRAPFLLSAAKRVAERRLDLESLHQMKLQAAREQLLACNGVGDKICNCVLLFAYGRQEAFPVDVWVMKALRDLYFPRRKRSLGQLQAFAATHFGPNAGYAQQYLFHYARSFMKRKPTNSKKHARA
jgi:N-glycosylase/DNA lyase